MWSMPSTTLQVVLKIPILREKHLKYGQCHPTYVLPNVHRTRAEDIPSVLVLGSSTRRVTRSRSTSLRMVAEAGACGETDLPGIQQDQ